ncbi:Stk1 family PASTA domain-containing Ser/Thr kinase [Lacticaseibacillus pabuli]|uniref:non-specific serine/threonine protein kinase n=1 Tax=Lacticaseibacillus pabuli TaxID=3025672 RepID=A0ABY7WV54_9LACO|nr:Stk1 family PASTA domain-containing Ser/Thr kinase [Lacticaseibacillus sp. KACC 23028]WDF83681.1 Stk1 family PASTA domain-containing Ser/Thr kinase [Lacticaseibacillus sp. KACC 23028]
MIEPGMILDERYKLTKTLGEGGMANVYLAHDLILNRDVAVKVLRLDLQNDKGTLRRFRREAMATLELNHPNIVSIYDVGESEGQQYLVMEYVHGTNLKTYIAQHFPIPYAKVIAFMKQILSAVQEAHNHNIIHRDLKPQNILVDDHETAKIADFGIAVALSDNANTQTNSLLGSVHYMSPEQARGALPTRQSDIYALGIILYEMLTGRVPFEGDSAVTIALKHFQESVPSVREFDPRIPQALENVVLKATAKDPNQRYTSAEAMSEDLATSLDASRANEPVFVPKVEDDMGETRVMTDLPSALRDLDNASRDNTVSGNTIAPRPVAETYVPDTDAPDTKRKPNPKRRRNLMIAAGVAIALVLITVLIIILPKGDVSIPDVKGMSLSQARTTLDKAKLGVGDETEETSNKYSKGEVISTNPNTGTSVKSGSAVDLVISSGGKRFKVGDYVGSVYSDVASDLRKKGFTVRKREDTGSTEEAGTVLKQSIKAGKTVVAKGKTITLTVASAGESFKMADLSKYNYQGVMGYANDHNLTVKYTGATTGLVVQQDPAIGTTVHDGATISVTFASGYGTTSRSNSTNGTTQSSSSQQAAGQNSRSQASSSVSSSSAPAASSSQQNEQSSSNDEQGE